MQFLLVIHLNVNKAQNYSSIKFLSKNKGKSPNKESLNGTTEVIDPLTHTISFMSESTLKRLEKNYDLGKKKFSKTKKSPQKRKVKNYKTQK